MSDSTTDDTDSSPRTAVERSPEVPALVVAWCPLVMPSAKSWSRERMPAFGAADAFGFVGESPVAWSLRDQIAFLAPRPAHVLVTGASGTGKELAALALHELSPRATR